MSLKRGAVDGLNRQVTLAGLEGAVLHVGQHLAIELVPGKGAAKSHLHARAAAIASLPLGRSFLLTT